MKEVHITINRTKHFQQITIKLNGMHRSNLTIFNSDYLTIKFKTRLISIMYNIVFVNDYQ